MKTGFDDLDGVVVRRKVKSVVSDGGEPVIDEDLSAFGI